MTDDIQSLIPSNRFRIVTNGLRFRVERLDWVGMLWWKKQEWLPARELYRFGHPIAEFPTLESAQWRAANDIRELKADMRGWQPVSPDTGSAPSAPSAQPRFVYRLQPSDKEGRTFEIGECDDPRSYVDGWCDRRVCEGFWGDEKLCRQTVEAMNAALTGGANVVVGKES